MAKCLKALLYGDTLVLAGLQASLASDPTIEVTCLEGLTTSEQELVALRPNVVIFDLGAVQPAFHYALVEKLPDLLLVGIDPSSNRVFVWSGQQVRELSTRDLLQIIEHHAADTPEPRTHRVGAGMGQERKGE